MCFKEKLLSTAFSVFFFFPLSSFLSLSSYLSLSLSPSLFLSPYLSLTLSPTLSLSLSCGFCLDRVLADVKNGLANCNF